MATRPVFVPKPTEALAVLEMLVEFKWFAGMSIQQKRRSIAALHEAARRKGIEPVLEISTKSDAELGVALSAFNLVIETKDGVKVTVEAAYQGGKVFERGGPYRDLYGVPGKQIKADARLRASGQLIAFDFGGTRWPLEPKTVFYDWLYIQALIENPGLSKQLLSFRGFSDIEFNPDKSINCQARAAALYVALQQSGRLQQALHSREEFIRMARSATPG